MPTPTLTVTPEEHGMKLLRFLERRLADCPPSGVLHRWIRTGQVRVNSGRSKPFTLLIEDDIVRLPPFAIPRDTLEVPLGATSEPTTLAQTKPIPADAICSKESLSPLPFLGDDLPILAATPELLILGKPGGLAVQPGTGHDDSVVDRLNTAYARHSFIPAPAHRIDRHTSGLLLVGRTHAALRDLHALFVRPGAIMKEYLAWVTGIWPHDEPKLLTDILGKDMGRDGLERITCLQQGHMLPFEREIGVIHDHACGPDSNAPNALCVVTRLRQVRHEGMAVSLLHVRLLTGRTHQIRVQLASRKFSIIGDGRYSGPRHTAMLLHALALTLPDGARYEALPAWPPPFAVNENETSGTIKNFAG